MAGKTFDAGLDLTNVDVTTPEEIASFRSQVLEGRRGKLMYPLPAYSFVVNNRPDMMKLHFRQMKNAFEIPDEGTFRILAATTMLHWYVCHRYTDGIIHEIRCCQREGLSKAQVNDILAIAFTHCGPSGFKFVYEAGFDYMETYVEPDNDPIYPPGWDTDEEAIRSGMDYSVPEMTAADREALFGWYERTVGEVPRSVQLLEKYNPTYLKANRAKLEGAIRGGLPKQLLPYMLIHYNINRGFAGGIREWTLIGKAWGMSKAQVVHAITFATGYMTGVDGLYIVDDAIGSILEEWK